MLGQFDDRGVQVGSAVVLQQPEADRSAAAPADLAHPRHLGAGRRNVGVVALALADAAGALEHTGAVATEHVGEREQLVGLGVGAGHRTAVGHLVEERAAGAETQRSGPHRLGEQVGHHGQVVGRRRLLFEPACTHRVLTQCAVPDHATDVEALRQPGHALEVLAVRHPVPRQSLEDRVARDVLDALHHRRQVSRSSGLHGAKVTPQLPITTLVMPW